MRYTEPQVEGHGPVMNGEARFWVWIVGIIAALILGIIAVAASLDYAKARAMAEHGYEETVQPGSASTYWQKAKPKEK